VATATVADLRDLETKVERAMQLRGARYLHVLVPCPLGWGSPAALTIRLARLATQTGLFPVFESRDGEITEVTQIRQLVPVEAYLRPQKRFAHLFSHPTGPATLIRLQELADRNIARYDLVGGDAGEA
jgi:pyruvate ferredoxin oxidoreductase beta subunit